MSARRVLKPSQVLRLIRAGKLADSQPRGAMKIVCEAKRHPIEGETESPSFWENGMYASCGKCKRWTLARIIGPDFEIDLTGERRKYPMFRDSPCA